MITIATYRNLMSAELAKARLEAEGIKAMLADEFSYTLGYGSVIGGVRLQVDDAEAERAKEILAGEEFTDLADNGAFSAELEQKTGGTSKPLMKWPVLLLFLSGILCLIVRLIILGEILLVAGLWILYGRLSADRKNETPPE